jgi:3-hydroxybutyryl-CoA dehydrogenase
MRNTDGVTIETVGVVGLGTMGAGIAEVFARAGLQVVAVEVDDTFLDKGRGRLETSFQRAVDRGRLQPDGQQELLGRLQLTTDRSNLVAAQLVVEAVPEHLTSKAALFAELDEICPPETVFATNTSSLPVTAIAAGTQRPGRVVGMHFFNPAPVMRLVEVVRTVLSEDDVVDTVRDLAERCTKTPIVVDDRAGFVANALLLPYLNHAARLVETAQASVDGVDAAVREATGLPMGPLALMDLIGLDVCVPILDVLWEEFRDRRYAATPLLRRLAVAGRLGRKTGHGWYRYDAGEPVPTVDAAGIDKPFTADDLVDAHLADAVRMVDDGYACEADVDTAMRLGCGYPKGPFELLADLPVDRAGLVRAMARR